IDLQQKLRNMKNLYKILFVALIGLFSFQAKATHYLGGEITWECLSNGNYKFTCIIYKECGIGAANYVSNILNTPSGSVTMTQVSVEEVSPACLGNTSPKCGVWASGKGAVQRFTLQATVTLSGVPPAGGWDFYWLDGARPSLVNTTAGNYYLRATMYPYTPVGATAPNNTSTCFDNSPKFKELGSIAICVGSPFTYNHLAADKDLDSLYVRFSSPMDYPNSNITWKPGYSVTSPYPSNLSHPGVNSPITVDGKTGEISMNI